MKNISPKALAKVAKLSINETAVFNIVVKEPGLSLWDIAERFYVDRTDGGPDRANVVVSNYIVRANNKLRRRCWQISGRPHGKGYKLVYDKTLPEKVRAKDKLKEKGL